MLAKVIVLEALRLNYQNLCPENHLIPASELRIPLPHKYDIQVIYLLGCSITLHIPVGKARSTRFGFRISRILLQKGTGHSLPLHFHTLFSVREKKRKEIKIGVLEEDFFPYLLVLSPVDMKTYQEQTLIFMGNFHVVENTLEDLVK